MQVSPSFFDSPASQWAEFMPSHQEAGKDIARPDVTIVFCAMSKPNAALDGPEQKLILNTFRSYVRSTLLLLGGIECQEKEGTHLIASSARSLSLSSGCSFAHWQMM